MSAAKVIESGIAPQPTLDEQVLALAQEIGLLFMHRAQLALDLLNEAQDNALARIEQFVPQDRLLSTKEAAAYLGYSVRWLDNVTRPGTTPLIQYSVIGSEKRFRKSWLDHAIDSGAVKCRKTTRI